jgi:hypothetical protein
MGKLYRLYQQYEEECLVFLAICVIVLLLMDIFKSNSNIGAKEIVTAVAAITSSFFLYLSFRENRKRLDILIHEPDFNILEKQVSEQEQKVNEEVFTYKLNDITNPLNYPGENLKRIKYNDFCISIYGLFSHIQSLDSYKKCILLLNNQDKVKLNWNDVPAAQRLSNALHTVELNISFLFDYYADLMFLFDSIEKSLIIRERKVSLFKRLNKLHREYSLLLEDYYNENGIGYKLREFKMIFVFLDELKIIGSGFDTNYLVPYTHINKINEKYGL